MITAPDIHNSLLKTFTWEELSKHNTPDDAYIAVRGSVYDITNFINRHPGGEDILLMVAGKDATQIFETYHELGKVDLTLKKYYIGALISNELPVFPDQSDFHKTVKKRVEDYFRKNQLDPKNTPFIWIRYAWIYGLLIGSYYSQYYIPFVSDHILLQVLLAIALGFAAAQVGLNPLHDASHFAVTHNPWVWKLLGATHDFLNGSSFLVWEYQHFLGHHVYTNIADADPDIVTGDPDIRRIKPSQRWFSHYMNQHLFVPLIYGFLAFKVRIQDIFILYVYKSNDRIRVNQLTSWHTFAFWGGKAFFILYRVLVPMLFHSAWKVLALLVIADFTASYWLACSFQANHVVDEVEWPLPDDSGLVQTDWAEMQVITTQDYAHDSAFWTSIVGSLNFQAVHHLFPQISQHHYPLIAPIVKETCAEYGIRYYYKDTFWEAFRSHVEHLHNMGQPPNKLD
ncbi:11250_t:CDS:10 [Paraglomus occultum]|uniref:11250_t:CDS:1 n=1 Tax=Paraglomus occultum TaxID=144539 RepID=A0A9N8W4B6_9GLOM|nr:11250_t:CDS:10 [Paraglomus occultum]